MRVCWMNMERTIVKPGYQCLSGKVALGYARARDVVQGVAGGDVQRSQDQQRVIMAVRDKVLSNLPGFGGTQQCRFIMNSLPACTRIYRWMTSCGWRC